MGVVLSGTLDDGSLGLRLIKEHGGLAIVQAPDDALYPDMPKNAMATVSPDHVTTAEELGPLLNRLGREPVPTEDLNRTAVAEREERPDTGSMATMLTCPECGGTVRVTESERKELYHCHAGHSFTELSLETHQSTRVDSALSHAYRALVEHATILRRLAERSKAWGHGLVVEQMEEKARDAEQRAVLIRRALSERGPED
jgi:two-component system chemotaxis response regulator CheB